MDQSVRAIVLIFIFLTVSTDATLGEQSSQVPIVASVSSDGIQRATITLDSYSYAPNHVIVEAGKPVELTLTSVTTITPHNFIIKELSVEQDVSAGKSVVVRFTPAQTGTYLIYCDKRLWPLPSHRDKGMEGMFEVR